MKKTGGTPTGSWFAVARSAVVGAIFVLPIVGCAGTPPPRAELGAAEQAIDQARAAQAAQYAPLQLRQAEQKLQAARSATDDDRERARRLAEQAQVDAELAAAVAERQRDEVAVDEMRRSLEALRNQAKGPSRRAIDQPPRPQ